MIVVPVNLKLNDTVRRTYAYLDPGSSISLIQKSFLKKFNINSSCIPQTSLFIDTIANDTPVNFNANIISNLQIKHLQKNEKILLDGKIHI